MNSLTLQKISGALAVLAIAAAISSCASQQTVMVAEGSTAVQYTSYATYPETIPRWGSANPHGNPQPDSRVEVSFKHSDDWGRRVLAQLPD